MSDVKLLPCPFCGSEAHLQEVTDNYMCFVCCMGAACWCSVGENYDRDAMPDHKFFTREEEFFEDHFYIIQHFVGSPMMRQ